MQQQQTENQNGLAIQSSILSAKITSADEKEIAKVMYQVNLLSPYPLQDEMIILWTKTLMRLRKWVSPMHLQKTIDAYLTGELEWHREDGINNIIIGVQMIERED